MIRIVFEGGLGNQIFEFVMGRYLQKYFNDEIEYDVSKYLNEAGEYRNFELESFEIPSDWHRIEHCGSRFQRMGIKYLYAGIVTKLYFALMKAFNVKGFNKKLDYYYQKLLNIVGVYWVHNPNSYGPPNKSWTKDKLFLGQWIWPAMCEEYKDEILDFVKFKITPSIENQVFLDLINSTNSVGVHIRRGDYVTLGLVVCSLRYYEYCMDLISEQIDNPTFFVFSDDIAWVKGNIKTNKRIIYVDNHNSAPEDMQLLSSCQHFILSNSTFSWWSAFLSKNLNKIVIAPKYWKTGTEEYRTPLILDSMVLVDNRKFI